MRVALERRYKEVHLLQVVTDILCFSFANGVTSMDYNSDHPITEIDRLVASFAGKVDT